MFYYSKSRLIGISDGIFAVVLTIMVLDIKSPVNESIGPMTELLKHLLIYFVSFGIVSEYWVYHQELLNGIKKATPRLTITNIYYLCFISLTPFATAWLNDSFFESGQCRGVFTCHHFG
ncbi:TMEM175 family protein [Lentilactobacillus kisonensis]|uniref:TMEM175 family protein n=1 Tax=Lentilactobacillus kisonensis TaxID=481722 RepID=UPI000B15983E|nr:TMEM175 family protein [Lentilactobacillus kisonensis]